MDGRYAGTAADSFLRGFSMMEAVRQRDEALAQQAEDRAYQRSRDEAADAYRTDRDAVVDKRYDEAVTLANVERAYQRGREAKQDQWAQDDRAYIEATRPSVDEVRGDRALDREQRKTALSADRARVADYSWQVRDRKRREQQAQSVRDLQALLHEADQLGGFDKVDPARLYDALDGVSGGVAAVMRPEAREAVDILREGAKQATKSKATAITDARAIGAFNTLFKNSITAGAPTNAKGEPITNRQVSRLIIRPTKNGPALAAELEVTAKKKDGTEYKYKAPLTMNRSGDDDDEVMLIPAADVMNKVTGYGVLHQQLNSPALKPIIEAEIIRRSGRDGLTGTAAKSGAQQQYLKYVADNVFGGDIKKAYESIRGGNLKQIASSMAGKMAELQKTAPLSQRKTYDQLYQEAETILRGAAAENATGSGSTPGGAPADGGLTPAELAELERYRAEQE